MARRTCAIDLPTDQDATVRYADYSHFECEVTFEDDETEDGYVTSGSTRLSALDGFEVDTRRDITKDVIQAAVDKVLDGARGEVHRVNSVRVTEVTRVRTWWADD